MFQILRATPFWNYASAASIVKYLNIVFNQIYIQKILIATKLPDKIGLIFLKANESKS